MNAARSSTAIATTGTADRVGGALDAPRRPCGRFAPSPTGDLHLGSLLAALGSYLSARSTGSDWRIRIEDVDRAREVPGATDRILATLEAFGFEWDGPVVYQSRRTEAYAAALERLTTAGLIYPCSCTRRQLSALPRGSDGEAVYPGTCSRGAARSRLPPSLRFRVPAGARVAFEDGLQGKYEQEPAAVTGDFIVRRRDGFFAYQLAVVVDDAAQGVTHVVRGSDLLDNTPRQILLQRALGLATPHYAHLPVLLEPNGEKLAKSRRAVPLDTDQAPRLLVLALRLLRQDPPAGLEQAALDTIWAWARGNWDAGRLSGVRALRLPATGLGSAEHLAVR